ncbi:MAG: hypothetical protein ACFCVA_05115 [Gammaproteobacteria bacterium]
MGSLEATPSFEQRLWGRFSGVLRWPQLEVLWQRVLAHPSDWYIYDLRGEPPVRPVSGEALVTFLRQVDKQLRREHAYDYCGIVYADDVHKPSLIKIYDPNHLGAVCGLSGSRVLPRWVMSRMQPTALSEHRAGEKGPPDASTVKWWQRLFRPPG